MDGGEPAFTQFAVQQRRLDLGRLRAVPDRPGGSLRRLVRQPRPHLVPRVQDGDLERAWPSIGNLQPDRRLDRDGNGQWGGRVCLDPDRGRQGRVTISGDTLRSALGLRSTWVNFMVKPRTS